MFQSESTQWRGEDRDAKATYCKTGANIMTLLDRRQLLTSAGTLAVSTAASAAILRGACAAGKSEDNNGVHYRSARDLAAALAARKVSSAELVDLAIARIEARDGRLNAVVVRNFERARLAAAEADKALARGERRLLLGVPMTVKESFNVAGLPTTWGIPTGKGFQPREDAVAVQRLKAAGAIVLGKTNVPLVLGDFQSYNEIYGTTNNPWDITRTPGGSSGGAAASLAAGFVPLELGSDIGGSLRNPAHFCGVFAHKPSYGLLPGRGHTPPGGRAIPYEVDLAVIGPMARTAADLALALDILAGPDGPQATAYRLALPDSRQSELKNFRILVIDEHPLLPTSREVREALDRMVEKIGKTGAKIMRSSPLVPDLALQGRTYTRLLLSVFGTDLPENVYSRLQDVAKSIPSTDISLASERVRGFVISHRDWMKADRARAGLAERWRELFREFDVVLCPIMPTTAFSHDHSDMATRRIVVDGQDVRYGDQTMWAGVATLTGLPATAVPIGVSEGGLPIGMQIVGPYLEDRTPLAFAALAESEFGGFTPPPGYAG
jgi:amidase